MEIRSWGANNHGQLGQGHFEDTWISRKIDKTELKQSLVSKVVGGGGHTAFITSGGKLLSCGLNEQGQLGSACADIKNSSVPRLVGGISVQVVASGWDFNVAISSCGQLWSWGSNSFGQTGHSTTCKKIVQPAIVEGLKEVAFSDVSAGLRHAAALASSGDLWMWGDTRWGQVPSSGCVGRISGPVRVNAPEEVKRVCCGAFFTLFVSGEKELFGLGDNRKGQLAWDPQNESSAQGTVSKLSVPRCLAVAAGWSHVLMIDEQGHILTWGRGDYGQLGRSCPTLGWAHRPGLVTLPCPASQVCCGSEHSLALTEDGCLFAWGWNEHGMCALPEKVAKVPLPRRISFEENARVLSVGSGAGHSFACLLSS